MRGVKGTVQLRAAVAQLYWPCLTRSLTPSPEDIRVPEARVVPQGIVVGLVFHDGVHGQVEHPLHRVPDLQVDTTLARRLVPERQNVLTPTDRQHRPADLCPDIKLVPNDSHDLTEESVDVHV